MRHDRESVAARICRLAAEQVAADASTVGPETNFFADLNYDSLDIVDFTMNVEDEFDITVSDEQAQEVRTVGAVIELVLAALPTRDAAAANA